jgi:SAM-dependent methyltransferase
VTSNVWDERADAYRRSPTHAAGPDLDLLVEWAGPGEGRDALDVATGGGHLARRLAEAGWVVTTTDASPGMRPTVVSRAEELPFADRSFDLVATRLAAHHFGDVGLAVRELARVARGRVLVEDMVFVDDRVEEAEKLRDPSHMRTYTEAEWRRLAADSGLEILELVLMDRVMSLPAWFARTGCQGEQAERVRELLGHRLDGETLTTRDLLIRAARR